MSLYYATSIEVLIVIILIRAYTFIFMFIIIINFVGGSFDFCFYFIKPLQANVMLLLSLYELILCGYYVLKF